VTYFIDGRKEVADLCAELENNLETVKGMHQMMLAALKAKNPIERLDVQFAAMETRLAALKADAAGAFEALGEEQRRIAESSLAWDECKVR
jgi:hypothetical protein